jgi:hypothetical protein
MWLAKALATVFVVGVVLPLEVVVGVLELCDTEPNPR